MLLRFGIANHRSIRNYQELFFTAARRIKRKGLTMPVSTVKEAAVPLIAIYGPNAAGKSNLIDAMDEMQRRIVGSHTRLGVTDEIPRYPFQFDDARETPTQMDCSFTIEGPQKNELEFVYEYGFEFTEKEFTREWLHRIVRKTRQRTQLVFDRTTDEGKVNVDIGTNLKGENKTIEKLTRPNSLFLSAAAQNNHPQLTPIYEYFSSQWHTILGGGAMLEPAIAERLDNYEHLDLLLRIMRQADLGIVNINVEDDKPDERTMEILKDVMQTIVKRLDLPDEGSALRAQAMERYNQSKRLRFAHSAEGDSTRLLEYRVESQGTQILLSYLIPALEALSKGSLLVIDELDTSLHPNLSRAFISLFAKKESNPHGAQLCFSTHDVSLLSSGLLQQDEIWIAEKDRAGVTNFVSLVDFSLRSRDNIEKVYRDGRLGGVPISADFFVELEDKRTIAES